MLGTVAHGTGGTGNIDERIGLGADGAAVQFVGSDADDQAVGLLDTADPGLQMNHYTRGGKGSVNGRLDG